MKHTVELLAIAYCPCGHAQNMEVRNVGVSLLPYHVVLTDRHGLADETIGCFGTLDDAREFLLSNADMCPSNDNDA